MSPRRSRPGQRGAALLLVLWLILLLTALVGTFALSARIEQIQGRVLSHAVVGDQAARAGLEYALLRLGDPDPQTRWIADGRAYDWSFNGIALQLRMVDETGRIDLNAADHALLSALMVALGAEAADAERLAGDEQAQHHPDGRKHHRREHQSGAVEGIELGHQNDRHQEERDHERFAQKIGRGPLLLILTPEAHADRRIDVEAGHLLLARVARPPAVGLAPRHPLRVDQLHPLCRLDQLGIHLVHVRLLSRDLGGDDVTLARGHQPPSVAGAGTVRHPPKTRQRTPLYRPAWDQTQPRRVAWTPAWKRVAALRCSVR